MFKKQLGNLGRYLIERAQIEIKELNQKTLFQKAEIKKRFIERSEERTIKLKQHFKESYDQFLNQSLSSTLLSGKEKFLNIKNNLIKELKLSLFKLIKQRIDNNYKFYIDYLLNSIKNVTKTIDNPQEVELILNNKDYDYFIKNFDKIVNLFKNPIEINKDKRDFIGGFKISLVGGVISYDYTIDNLINRSSSYLQMEISKIIDDSEIKEIEIEFEEFIKNQKKLITEYLTKYDQIQI
ncbi:MAG: V-type ATP synthase subunit E [Promethearchaeota archaeon]